jgi:hypothetical protein
LKEQIEEFVSDNFQNRPGQIFLFERSLFVGLNDSGDNGMPDYICAFESRKGDAINSD